MNQAPRWTGWTELLHDIARMRAGFEDNSDNDGETDLAARSRALIRSELWNPQKQLPRSALPSTGEILAAVTHDRIDGRTYDRELPDRLKTTLY